MSTTFIKPVAAVRALASTGIPLGRKTIGVVAFAALAGSVPFVLSESFVLRAVNVAGIFVLAAYAVDLMFGRTRLLSFANPAFFAIGAYVSASAVVFLQLPFAVALPLAALAAMVAGAIVSLPALRMSGIYLAIATFAFVLIVHQLTLLFNKTMRSTGLVVPPASLGPIQFDSDVNFYFLWLTLALVVLVPSSRYLRAKTGRAFTALRDTELGAQAIGVSLVRYKMLAFAMSALTTGIAGSLYAHYIGYLSPDSFELALTITLVTMAVVGGLGSLRGSILGAFFITLMPVGLSLLPGRIEEFKYALFGLLLIFVLIFSPRGLNGILESLWSKAAKHAFLGTTGSPSTAARATESWAGAMTASASTDCSRWLTASADRRWPGRQVEIEGVGIRFGGLQALEDVSFAISPGSILGLIGPNGAGKSTLLNILSGFTRPMTGAVRYEGADLLTRAPHARAELGIGRTFQNLQLFGSASVLDNFVMARHTLIRTNIISEGLRTARSRESEAKARGVATDIAELLGLARFRDWPVADLPFGMQKMVELGRALAVSPRLLLLDEVATGMSRHEVDQLALLIRSLRASFGITILLVEHNMRFVMGVCDEIVVLNFGRKIAEGSPADVRSHASVIEAYLGHAREVVGATR